MNEELIRVVPKPEERPVHVGSIFSSDLDLTPEKKRKPKFNDSRLRSKTKQKAPTKTTVTTLAENQVVTDNVKSCGNLGEPSINSSARIGLKLQELQESKFNPGAAISEKFESSETARSNFAEKVASAVNVRRVENKYSDLISLNVVPNDVISSHTQQRVSLKGKANKVQDYEPDIMDFFSDDLEVENATFHFDLLEEKEEIPTISHKYAFDLLAHMNCWQHKWK